MIGCRTGLLCPVQFLGLWRVNETQRDYGECLPSRVERLSRYVFTAACRVICIGPRECVVLAQGISLYGRISALIRSDLPNPSGRRQHNACHQESLDKCLQPYLLCSFRLDFTVFFWFPTPASCRLRPTKKQRREVQGFSGCL